MWFLRREVNDKTALVQATETGDKGVFHRIVQDPLIEVVTKTFSLLSIGLLSFALAFDVGFFSGLKSNVFTLFTLSEHLLFTAQMIPLAFFIIILGAVYLYMASNIDLRIKRKDSRSVSINGGLAVIIISTFMAAIYIFAPSFEREEEINPFRHMIVSNTIAAMTITILPVVIASWLDRKYRSYILSVCIYVALFLFAFDTGYSNSYIITGNNSKLSTQKVTLKDNKKLEARVIISGSRGLLLYDIESGEIVFLKWENLESISSEKRK